MPFLFFEWFKIFCHFNLQVSWLTIPTNITPSASSLSGTLPSISSRSSVTASLKNKDGMGIKRKNSNKAASSDVSPSNSNVNGVAGNVIMAHDVSVTHLQMIEEFLSNEEAYISQFLSVISQVSSKQGGIWQENIGRASTK